jgi:outer membrane biogenesis lipoprotein LolB
MSKAIRTALSLVVCLVLFGALTMAQPGGNNADKDKNTEHHSRLAKVAFWRHHKPASAKQAAGKKDQKRQQLSPYQK